MTGDRSGSRKLPEPGHQEELFRQLVASVRDYAIFVLDPSGVIVTWNAGAERIKGYTASEAIGRHFSLFYPEEEVRARKCELELEIAEREGRFEEEGWRLRKDGSRFWANVVINALRDEHDKLIGFSKITRDLTERRQREEERLALLAAETANRSKDEFLAMLGHELRNPMAPILTALQLMQLRGELATSREQRVIERQVKHMLRLIDDLLDVERITRGKIELKKARVDVRAVIAHAVEVVAPLMEEKRHQLALDVAEEALAVDADEARLIQVVGNLATNAAKYTSPGGHIAIAARRQDDSIVIEVRDDGAGLDAALLPKVFDLFVQGVQTAERAAGGLGLGLALARRLTELHGGRIEASSAGPGSGSTFTVRLPALPGLVSVPAPPARPAAPCAGKPLRVVIVDDNEDALFLLQAALESSGHEVHTADNPVDALELLKSLRPDVAILDIGLPVMNGYELAAELRAALGSATPRLIALTGYGQLQDKARSAEAGFDAHLVKPVELERLLACLTAESSSGGSAS